MREHELELIAALAEGRLEDETEARALIASSAEARTEFEAQKTAIAALAQTGSVSMSDSERSALRRDLWTRLRASEPAASTPRPWYYRWVPVAAGLFLIIGLVSVINQSGGLDGIVTADQAASETTVAGSDTTPAGSETTPAGSDTTEAAAEEFDSGDEAGEGAVTEEPTDAGGEADDGDQSQELAPSATAFYAAAADEIRSRVEAEPEPQTAETPSPSELAECLAQAGLEGYEVQDVNTAPDETAVEAPEEAVPYIAAIPVDAELPTAEVAFVELESCDLIHIDR